MAEPMLPYKLQVTRCDASATGRAGLLLVEDAARVLGLPEVARRAIRVGERRGPFDVWDKLRALILTLADGGECIDDINVLGADHGFCRVLGRDLPSADTERDFLHAFHDDSLIEAAKQRRAPHQLAFIPQENAALRGLAEVNRHLVHQVAARGKCMRATLDHDATIQECHKRLALPHYKGGRGYQPACVVWVEQDLVVADEYRDGNVPARMANLPLIRASFGALPASLTSFAFRADSACYDEDVLKWLADERRDGGPQAVIDFTISAAMSPELRAVCAGVVEPRWQLVDERSNETVMCADVEFAPGNWPKTAAPLRYVAVRIRKKQGDLFSDFSDTKYLAVVSNRKEMAAPELLRWHWQKAGTIEHLHDVDKNDLGAAVPPCRRFGANAAWYRLTLLTYNMLSALKSLALPAHLSSARPKRLRFCLLHVVGFIVSHARSLVVRVGAAADEISGFFAARARLARLATVPSPSG